MHRRIEAQRRAMQIAEFKPESQFGDLQKLAAQELQTSDQPVRRPCRHHRRRLEKLPVI